MAGKKEPKSALAGFNMKSYLKQDRNVGASTAEEEIEEGTGEEVKTKAQEEDQTGYESEKNKQTEQKSEKNKSASETIDRIVNKKKPIENTSDVKIPFMNYLPVELHDKFSFLFLEAKQELRGKTRKALSQTELVEAVLRFAVDGWQERKGEILEIAERIINNRPTKE